MKSIARTLPGRYTPSEMDWYYAVNDQRMGPVSEPEFLRLIATGQVGPETMVWREGMTVWQPCREVEPVAPSPAAMCSDCGAMFPENELIPIDDRRVCAACKPTFLQRMREGIDAEAPADRVLDSKLLTLREVLALSWSVWLRNLGVITLLVLVTAIPLNLILEAAAPGAEAAPREYWRFLRITMFAQLLIGSLSSMAVVWVVGEAVAGREVTFGAALKHGLSRWLPAIGTGFLENIILGLLCLLLVVPGIIWAGYYMFSTCVVSLRGLAGTGALDYSKELVVGRWWRVVGFVLAALGIIMFPVILVQSATPSDNGIASVVAALITDVLTSYLAVTIGVLFLNLDALKLAGRLD